MTSPGVRRMLRWLLPLVVLGLLTATAYLLRERLLPPIAGWLDVGEAPQAADAALVLGGGLETRPFVAAALVRTGYVPSVLTTQPPNLLNERRALPTEVAITRDILLAREVPAEAIVLLPGECLNTFDEAQQLAAWMAQHENARVLVVTDTYHTRRARWIFQQVLGPAAARVRFISAPTDGFDASNWWRTDSGFVTYLKEYLRLAFYLVRYGRLGWYLAALLALLLAGWCWHRLRRNSTCAAPSPA